MMTFGGMWQVFNLALLALLLIWVLKWLRK